LNKNPNIHSSQTKKTKLGGQSVVLQKQKNFFFLKTFALHPTKKKAKQVPFRTKIKASEIRLSQEILQNFLL
jgi:hypothetical protein